MPNDAEQVNLLDLKPVQWPDGAVADPHNLADFIVKLAKRLEDEKLPPLAELELSLNMQILGEALNLLPKDIQIPFKKITLKTPGNDLADIGNALINLPADQQILTSVTLAEIVDDAKAIPAVFNQINLEVNLHKDQANRQHEMNVLIDAGKYARSRNQQLAVESQPEPEKASSDKKELTAEIVYEIEIEQQQEQEQQIESAKEADDNSLAKIIGSELEDKSVAMGATEVDGILCLQTKEKIAKYVGLPEDKMFYTQRGIGTEGDSSEFLKTILSLPKARALFLCVYILPREDEICNSIIGFSKNATSELWRRRDQFTDGLDLKHLPAGFYFQNGVVRYNALLERKQAKKAELIQPYAVTVPQINAFYLQQWLQDNSNTKLANFCNTFVGKPIDNASYQILQRHFVKLAALSDMQLDALNNWVLPQQHLQLDFIFNNLDLLSSLDKNDLAKVSEELLINLFPEKGIFVQGYSPPLGSSPKTLTGDQQALMVLAQGLQQAQSKTDLAKHKLFDPKLYKKYANILQGMNNEALIMLNCNQGEIAVINVLNKLAKLDPALQTFFKSQSNLESLLGPRNTDALKIIDGFSPKEKQWFMLLLQGHTANVKNDDLMNLVSAFQAFSANMSKLGLKSENDFKGPMPVALKNVKSLPSALNNMYEILVNCKDNARNSQWEEMQYLDLSATGAVAAVKEFKCHYVAKEANYSEEAGVNILDYAAPKLSWQELYENKLTEYEKTKNPKEMAYAAVKQSFWRYIDIQNDMAKLEFYRGVAGKGGALEILDKYNFDTKVKAGLLELLARCTTSPGMENKDAAQLLQDWQVICEILSLNKAPRFVKDNFPADLLTQIQDEFLTNFLQLESIPDLEYVKDIAQMVERVPGKAMENSKTFGVVNPLKIKTNAQSIMSNIVNMLISLRTPVGIFDINKINAVNPVYNALRFLKQNNPNPADLMTDPALSPLFTYVEHANAITTAIMYKVKKNKKLAETNKAAALLLSVYSTFHIEAIFKDEHEAVVENDADEDINDLDMEKAAIVENKENPEISAALDKLLEIYANPAAAEILEQLSAAIVANQGLTPEKLFILVDELNSSFIKDRSLKDALIDFSTKVSAPDGKCNFLQACLSEATQKELARGIFGQKPPEQILQDAKDKFGQSDAYAPISSILQQHLDSDSKELQLLVGNLEALAKIISPGAFRDILVALNDAYAHGLDADLPLLNQVLSSVVKSGNTAQLSFFLTHPDYPDKRGLLAKAAAFYTVVAPWLDPKKNSRAYTGLQAVPIFTRILMQTPVEDIKTGVAPYPPILNPVDDFFKEYTEFVKQPKTAPELKAFLKDYETNNKVEPALNDVLEQIRTELAQVPEAEIKTVTKVVPDDAEVVVAKQSEKKPGFLASLFGAKPKQETAAEPPKKKTKTITTQEKGEDPKISQAIIDVITTKISEAQQQFNTTQNHYNQHLSRILENLEFIAKRNPQAGLEVFDFVANWLKVAPQNAAFSLELNKLINTITELAKNSPEGDDQLGALLLCYKDKPKDLLELLSKLDTLTQNKPDLKLGVMGIISKMSNIEEVITETHLEELCNHPNLEQILQYYKTSPYPTLTQALSWGPDLQLRATAYQRFLQNPKAEPRVLFAADELQSRLDMIGGITAEQSQTSPNFAIAQQYVTDCFALRSKTPDDLLKELTSLRQEFAAEPPTQDFTKLVAVIAEIFYRTTGDELNYTQVAAVYSMLTLGPKPKTLEMATGEGKTRTTMVTLACLHAMGKTVDFATADLALVKRDYNKHKPFFQAQNIQTVLIYSNSPANTYQMDGINFFDYGSLGSFRAAAYSDPDKSKRTLVLNPNKQKRALVGDECDKMYYDSSNKSINIAADDPELLAFTWIYEVLMNYIAVEENRKLFDKSVPACLADFNAKLKAAVGEEKSDAFKKLLQKRPGQGERWLRAAVKAQDFEERKHFIIRKDVLVKTRTGEQTASRAIVLDKDGNEEPLASFSDGVQQCLHARLNIQRSKNLISTKTAFVEIPEKRIIYKTGFSRFLNDYKDGGSTLIGLTGTPGSDLEKEEMHIALGMEFFKAPRHLESKRVNLDFHLRTEENINKQICQYLEQARLNNQPMIIFCKDGKEVAALYAYLNGENGLKKNLRFDKNQKTELSHVQIDDPAHSQLIKGRTADLVEGQIKYWQQNAGGPYSFMANLKVGGKYRIVHAEFAAGFDPTTAQLADVLSNAEQAYNQQFLQQITADNPQDQRTLVKKAALQGMITIATPSVGRGVDYTPNINEELSQQFKEDKELAATNGLGVIVNFLPTERESDQMFGRSGRWGAPGSARLVLSVNQLGDLAKKYALKIKDIYKAPETFMRSLRDAVGFEARTDRIIKAQMQKLLDNVTDNYFNSLYELDTDLKRNAALDSWDIFLKAASSEWSSTRTKVDTILKSQADDAEKTEQITTELNRFNTAMSSKFDTLKQSFSSLGPDAPIFKDLSKVSLQGAIEYSAPVKTAPKFNPLRAAKYDKSHIGKLVKYDSGWERWRATLSRERPLMANTRAAIAGHGEVFLELKALGHKLKTWIKQGLFREEKKQAKPTSPHSPSVN